MEHSRCIVAEGFLFELTGFFCTDGTTTMTICVSGNGQSTEDLKGWVIEICPGNPLAFEEVNILSCEKKRRQANWVPAVAQKTSYELTGDIGINGVLISDWVGRYEEDPDVEFRVVFDTELEPIPFKVGLVKGDTIKVSQDTIHVSVNPDERQWSAPIEKSFCLFLVVPDGYRPDSVTNACVSATKQFVHICCQQNPQEGKSLHFSLCGCVRIAASVPLLCAGASGDSVHAAACDCFDVCDTIGFADDEAAFSIRDICVYPNRDSYDLTLLNTHCGKSVYRLDGKYTIAKK